METIECIKTRRSVRTYTKERIPEHITGEILEAAVQAPSAGNTQEWQFIVVSRPEIKKQIAEAAFGQHFIEKASLVIVVCADIEKIEKAYGERGVSLYVYQDTAAATQNLMLAAWERGIGSCWVGAFNEARIKGILVIPERVRPVAIIPMGYPLEKQSSPKKRPVKEVVHEERW